MGKLIDLTGRQFSRLFVIERCANIGESVQWLCRCSCGTMKSIQSAQLRSGHTRSCGCYSREMASITFKKHGMSNTRLYHIWENVVGRGTGRLHQKRYMDRGINICPEWLSFEVFAKDMGIPPTTKHTIDRIDNNKGYSKENCRWATRKENSRNRAITRFVTYKGSNISLAQLCESKEISLNVVGGRLKQGWDIERAISQPTRRKIPPFEQTSSER